MGYTADEFIAALPAAMRDWRVSGGPGEWRISAADGSPVAVIRIESRPERRIGALCLPVLHVRLDVDELSETLAAEFLRRFERGFHRGGG
jgi:hypothetical protein